MELKLDSLDYPNFINEALIVDNTRLRAISSMQDIIVGVDDSPSDSMRRKMESYGWTISATEYGDNLSIKTNGMVIMAIMIFGNYAYTIDCDLEKSEDLMLLDGRVKGTR
ncbi:hypothetical protein V496_06416 [Pseudogymnoascus sp. VKM F-4515 (FW-2607)]|nr:hypothetical protein V496_06416 [Pseudogymnoascus sp. VKM F-4515 (FW-2607)]